MVRYLNAHPDADVLYSDEDKLDLAGARCDPYFKPDWSPDHFLTCMYTCHFMVIRRTLLDGDRRVPRGLRGGAGLRPAAAADGAHHEDPPHPARALPLAQAAGVDRQCRAGQAVGARRRAGSRWKTTCGARGADAEVLPGGLPGRVPDQAADSRHAAGVDRDPDRRRATAPCGARRSTCCAAAIRSVVEKTAYRHYELIVVADAAGVLPGDASGRWKAPQHQVLRFERLGLFNFSAKVNAGVAASSGEHVLLFNDDLEVTSPEWLTAMLEYSQEPEIGAVGAKLLYPDGRLQHVGMVLGVAGVAAHAFHQHPGVVARLRGQRRDGAQLLGRDRRPA